MWITFSTASIVGLFDRIFKEKRKQPPLQQIVTAAIK